VHFDFRRAITDGTLVRLEIADGSDTDYSHAELEKLRVTAVHQWLADERGAGFLKIGGAAPLECD
jgi:hypothetical protein